jgi:hypothetical protein
MQSAYCFPKRADSQGSARNALLPNKTGIAAVEKNKLFSAISGFPLTGGPRHRRPVIDQ